MYTKPSEGYIFTRHGFVKNVLKTKGNKVLGETFLER